MNRPRPCPAAAAAAAVAVAPPRLDAHARGEASAQAAAGASRAADARAISTFGYQLLLLPVYRSGASTCATPRRPGKRARSRRPPRLADTEGSLSPRWQQAGTCQPARQEAGGSSTRGWTSCRSRTSRKRQPSRRAPATKVSVHVRRRPIRSPSGVATKPEKKILFTRAGN